MLYLLLATASLLSTGDDWSRFRGPGGNGDGVHVPLPQLNAEGLLWTLDLPGPGSSSPVVFGERLVLTCMVEGQRALLAYDLAASPPTELWRHTEPVAEHRQHRFNSYASATPALDENGVYLVAADGNHVAALGLDWKGEVSWRRELGGQNAQHGGGASAVVHEGVLVVAHDDENEAGSFLLGLDARDGEELWRRERASQRAAYSTPCLREGARGTELIFASTAHGLTAVDPKTGDLRWEASDLFEARVVASPVVAGDIVFAVAGKGGGGTEAAAVRTPSAEGGEAEVAWRARRNLPYVPTPLVIDGDLLLWSDGGILSRLDGVTGEEAWRERVSGATYSSPIRVGEAVCNVSRDGELVACSAGAEFEILGRLDLGEASDASPAVAKGMLLVRTRTKVFALGAEAAR